jgi:hypothetical protein
MFYGYRVVPGRGDETRSAEAFEVLNQPAKFARRFSLPLITWQGGLFPQRRWPPDAALEGPPPPDLRSFQPLAVMMKANWFTSAA